MFRYLDLIKFSLVTIGLMNSINYLYKISINYLQINKHDEELNNKLKEIEEKMIHVEYIHERLDELQKTLSNLREIFINKDDLNSYKFNQSI